MASVRWVSIAPYTLLAYVRKFDIATDFRIICREFNIEDSTERIVEQINAEVGAFLEVVTQRGATLR